MLERSIGEVRPLRMSAGQRIAESRAAQGPPTFKE